MNYEKYFNRRKMNILKRRYDIAYRMDLLKKQKKFINKMKDSDTKDHLIHAYLFNKKRLDMYSICIIYNAERLKRMKDKINNIELEEDKEHAIRYYKQFKNTEKLKYRTKKDIKTGYLNDLNIVYTKYT